MSLACANLAYLYLSVPFIQMLKALAPVVTLLLSWAASLADPRVSTLGCVLVIAFGVFLAGVGEVRFVWAGFFVHCTLPFFFLFLLLFFFYIYLSSLFLFFLSSPSWSGGRRGSA